MADLIDENIYVKLNEKFNRNFFDEVRKKAGNIRNLSKLTGINLRMLCYYKARSRAVKISTLFKLLNFSRGPQGSEIVNILEPHIKEIKFGRRGKNVNPKLPIFLSMELARVLGHVIGDGGIYNKHANFTVTYSNKSNVLLDEFKSDIKNIFGGVSPKIFYNKDACCTQLFYPSIIGIILTKVAGIQTKEKKHVPKVVKNAPIDLKKEFLRALFDDEGNVNLEAFKLNIEMANFDVISNTKKLLEEMGINSGEIIKIERNKNESVRHKLGISGKSNLVRFHKFVGFSDINKQNRLETLVKLYTIKKSGSSEIESSIIDTLENSDGMSFFELAQYLQSKNIGSFRSNLRKLVKLGKIKFEIGHFGKGIRRIYRLERAKEKNEETRAVKVFGPEA